MRSSHRGLLAVAVVAAGTRLAEACRDDDGDGICNNFDSCPDNSLNDADGDGVCDSETLHCLGVVTCMVAADVSVDSVWINGVDVSSQLDGTCSAEAGACTVQFDDMSHIQPQVIAVSATGRSSYDDGFAESAPRSYGDYNYGGYGYFADFVARRALDVEASNRFGGYGGYFYEYGGPQSNFATNNYGSCADSAVVLTCKSSAADSAWNTAVSNTEEWKSFSTTASLTSDNWASEAFVDDLWKQPVLSHSTMSCETCESYGESAEGPDGIWASGCYQYAYFRGAVWSDDAEQSDEGVVLFSLDDITDSDRADWSVESTCSGSVKYDQNKDALRLRGGYEPGETSITHSVHAGCSANYDFLRVSATAMVRSLEAGESCTVEVSLDGGDTWLEPLMTLQNGDDSSASDYYNGRTEQLDIAVADVTLGDLQLRVSLDTDTHWDYCYLAAAKIEFKAATTTTTTTTEFDYDVPVVLMDLDFTSYSDTTGWEYTGHGSHVYTTGAMVLLDEGYAQYDLDIDLSDYEAIEVYAVLATYGLEENDQDYCRFQVSLDDFDDMEEDLVTVTWENDDLTQFDGTASFEASQVPDWDDSHLSLRMDFFADHSSDQCWLYGVGVSGIVRRPTLEAQQESQINAANSANDFDGDSGVGTGAATPNNSNTGFSGAAWSYAVVAGAVLVVVGSVAAVVVVKIKAAQPQASAAAAEEEKKSAAPLLKTKSHSHSQRQLTAHGSGASRGRGRGRSRSRSGNNDGRVSDKSLVESDSEMDGSGKGAYFRDTVRDELASSAPATRRMMEDLNLIMDTMMDVDTTASV